MISISARNLAKSFGIHEVLKNVTFSVQQGDRIGLVGVNGCGKSTLLRILNGLESYDSGELSIVRGSRIGYLAQQDMAVKGTSIWKTLVVVYATTFQLEKRLREIESLMAEKHESIQEFQRLSSEYDKLTKRFEEADGYSWKSKILGVLNGLGFKPEQHDRPVDSLSGGELTRLCLARLLLQKPDILLLDEPTNHLDMDSLEWLQNTLSSYPGTVLIVSHDRYFMDHVCSGIIELMMGVCEQYNGNYSRYVQLRQERYEIRLRSYELQQKEIERQNAIIARYRMFNREKSIKAAESREKALERMDILEKPDQEKSIQLAFSSAKRTGEDVLFAENLEKSYGDKTLFRGFNLHVRSGEHVAIVGPNGVGKTTLFRVLLGEEKADAGSVRFGSNVQIGYYDQQQAQLHDDKTVLDEVWDRFPRMEQSNVRGALGMFLLTGDDVFQPIRTLSGGEKGRVALTTLMLQHYNLLLLDEPTNHLDMDSREALEDALSEYDGTIITVSHDRYFINRIATRIVEFLPGSISFFIGNYDDYLEKKNAPKETEEVQDKTKTQADKEKRRERLNKQNERQLRAQLKDVENAISAKEQAVADLESALSDPKLYADASKAEKVRVDYQNSKKELDELYSRWEQLESDLSSENT